MARTGLSKIIDDLENHEVCISLSKDGSKWNRSNSVFFCLGCVGVTYARYNYFGGSCYLCRSCLKILCKATPFSAGNFYRECLDSEDSSNFDSIAKALDSLEKAQEIFDLAGVKKRDWL